eukprot:CAMPEP_0197591956 /NCGR_PEP_ID=MMETSP1326-20131121/14173_1 /TAXON_ID=1155430 /ORGANISM="Genus nov. species nov., Strain RCC2288" /LENGTH=75 /DNA_ID=CAMNT_0043157549 /DNA_START=350 /DNA_END=573 /DNA_ORIENTATION=-
MSSSFGTLLPLVTIPVPSFGRVPAEPGPCLEFLAASASCSRLDSSSARFSAFRALFFLLLAILPERGMLPARSVG